MGSHPIWLESRVAVDVHWAVPSRVSVTWWLLMVHGVVERPMECLDVVLSGLVDTLTPARAFAPPCATRCALPPLLLLPLALLWHQSDQVRILDSCPAVGCLKMVQLLRSLLLKEGEPLTPERHCHRRRRRLGIVAVAVAIVRCELSLTEVAARCHDLCHKWQPSTTSAAVKTPTVIDRSLFFALGLRLRVGGCGSGMVEELATDEREVCELRSTKVWSGRRSKSPLDSSAGGKPVLLSSKAWNNTAMHISIRCVVSCYCSRGLD
ncbi:hypothetical protein KC344_g224 [Hortaea werneckii]|nr:hypothetical protein KC344_g224 [Hortaea werneckii]